MSSGFRIAIVGATGAVGGEFLRLFRERDFPVASLRLLASERSAGRRLPFGSESLLVETATPESFQDVDLAFFSAGASRSRALIPAALAAGAYVIDNSSAFRMDSDVPLVVPEVNGHEISPDRRLYAVPNCTAIILLVAINPLLRLAPIDRLIVSTYQSASGGGASMMRQLLDETRDYLAQTNLDQVVSGKRPPEGIRRAGSAIPLYAFNLFSHNTAIGEDGYNEEEAKVIAESRKILGLPNLRINVTCVRVPVLRAHTESVTVEFAGEAPSESAIREALESAPGVRIVDDRPGNRFPTPMEASGQGDVLVGRIRSEPGNPRAICLLISGDQLLKGAALNAVQIAERLIQIGQPVGRWA